MPRGKGSTAGNIRTRYSKSGNISDCVLGSFIQSAPFKFHRRRPRLCISVCKLPLLQSGGGYGGLAAAAPRGPPLLLPTSPAYAFSLQTHSYNDGISNLLTKFGSYVRFCVLSYHADVVVLFPFLSIRCGLVWLEGLGAEITWQDWNLLAMDLGLEDIIPSGRLVLQPKSMEVFDADFGWIRQSVSVCELAAQVGHISSLYRTSFDRSKSCLVSLLSSQIWRESLVLPHEWCAKFFLEIISTLQIGF